MFSLEYRYIKAGFGLSPPLNHSPSRTRTPPIVVFPAFDVSSPRTLVDTMPLIRKIPAGNKVRFSEFFFDRPGAHKEKDQGSYRSLPLPIPAPSQEDRPIEHARPR